MVLDFEVSVCHVRQFSFHNCLVCESPTKECPMIYNLDLETFSRAMSFTIGRLLFIYAQVALTALKKLKNIDVFVNLFEEWLAEKCQISKRTKHYVLRTITPSVSGASTHRYRFGEVALLCSSGTLISKR